jgi:hypothetical protein
MPDNYAGNPTITQGERFGQNGVVTAKISDPLGNNKSTWQK